MSYLDAPRLHFFGKYFANPSTINNNLSNFDLKPPLKLSWNPDGSAFFHFLDCRVSSAVRGDGTVLSGGSDDPITQATVTTPQSPPTKVAKIVDLDPDQQSITQLFGVVVTLALPGGQGGVTGKMAVGELRDLWFQRVAFGPGADGGASGTWQSVLTDLQWSGLDRSAFLQDLYNTSPDRLSIKFNCDAYDRQLQELNLQPRATRGDDRSIPRRRAGADGDGSSAAPRPSLAVLARPVPGISGKALGWSSTSATRSRSNPQAEPSPARPLSPRSSSGQSRAESS